MSFPLLPTSMPDPVTGLVHHTNRVAEGLALLIEQYRNKPRIVTLLSIYLGQVQQIEDCGWDLYTLRRVDTAVGAQLDLLGRIVHRPRYALNDASYRLWIKAQILVNRTRGSAEDTLKILKTLGYSHNIFIDYIPAAFSVRLLDTVVDDPFAIGGIVNASRTAGVMARTECNTQAHYFKFASVSGTQTPGFGFSCSFGSPNPGLLGCVT